MSSQTPTLMSMRRVCVAAAHPDDEVLGCGGTIARLRAQGAEVSVLFMTDGVGARKGLSDSAARKAMSTKAAIELGGLNLVHGPFADNAMDEVPLLEVVQHIEMHFALLEPDAVITHHGADLNIDHEITYRAVMTACRPLAGKTVHTIVSMEVPSATDWSASPVALRFAPQIFVDVSGYVNEKRAALTAYQDELRAHPHPRSVRSMEALMTLRGSQAGLDQAEAFELIRALR